MLASYHGHVALSKLLLQYGADPNRLNDRGQSPLAGAVFKAEDEVVDLLLEFGADVDAGRPSAWECVALFRRGEQWAEKFLGQRERLRGAGGTEGGAGGGGGDSTGSRTGGDGTGDGVGKEDGEVKENREGIGGTKEGVEII